LTSLKFSVEMLKKQSGKVDEQTTGHETGLTISFFAVENAGKRCEPSHRGGLQRLRPTANQIRTHDM